MQIIKSEKNKITFAIGDKKLAVKIKNSLTMYSGGLYDFIRFEKGLIHNCFTSKEEDVFYFTFTTLDEYKKDVQDIVKKYVII